MEYRDMDRAGRIVQNVLDFLGGMAIREVGGWNYEARCQENKRKRCAAHARFGIGSSMADEISIARSGCADHVGDLHKRRLQTTSN
jgi:hypothetical protein